MSKYIRNGVIPWLLGAALLGLGWQFGQSALDIFGSALMLLGFVVAADNDHIFHDDDPPKGG